MDTLTHAPHTEMVAQDVERRFVDMQFWITAADIFGPYEERRLERQALLDVLMERQQEAFVTEATTLAHTHYAERAIVLPDGRVRYFTRDKDSHKLDSITTIADDGVDRIVRHTMLAPQTFGFDNPVEIIASTSGELRVYAATHIKSTKGMKEAMSEVTGEEVADAIMREYFVSSLRAAREVQMRDDAQRLAADADARARYEVLERQTYHSLSIA